MPEGKFCGPCWQCKSEMWLPQSLYDAAMHGRSKITFYCGYGHGQVFAEGEGEEAKLRRERDRLFQRVAQLDDTIKAQHRELLVADKKLADLKTQRKVMVRRAKAGTCPCCHRTFRQMALHMKQKHPEFKVETLDAAITKNANGPARTS